MPPVPSPSLPFLTRSMLSFENGVSFALRVDMQADTVATLALRGITREATFEYKATTAASSLITTATFALSDVPIMVTIEDSARALSQGSAFITISLTANSVVIQQLVSGYLYAQKALSWPNTQQVDLRPSGGKIESKISANPAAGSNATISVPAGEFWKLNLLNIALVASATVANRRVYVELIQATGPVIYLFSSIDQVASTTRSYSGAKFGSIPDETNDLQILMTIPDDLVLEPLSDINVAATNLQATDDFTVMYLSIEKFFTTP